MLPNVIAWKSEEREAVPLKYLPFSQTMLMSSLLFSIDTVPGVGFATATTEPSRDKVQTAFGGSVSAVTV